MIMGSGQFVIGKILVVKHGPEIWTARWACVLTVCFVVGSIPISSGAAELDWPTFGDFSYRSTNFYADNYDFVGGWVESRFTLSDLVCPGDSICVEPYIKLAFAHSNRDENPWESTLVYGVGLQSRPLLAISTLKRIGWLSWISGARFYAEYLKHEFLRNDAPWFPDYDARAGAEIWREFNVDLSSEAMNPSIWYNRLWGELWWDGSYRSTNFFAKSYDSWTTGLVVRVGWRLLKPNLGGHRDIFLMPYLLGELTASRWGYFWENRCILGFGLRVMPFQHAESKWLRRLRIYAEYQGVVKYFRDQPSSLTPDEDVRIGLSFSNSWWR
jgi:hypothetical protein